MKVTKCIERNCATSWFHLQDEFAACPAEYLASLHKNCLPPPNFKLALMTNR